MTFHRNKSCYLRDLPPTGTEIEIFGIVVGALRVENEDASHQRRIILRFRSSVEERCYAAHHTEFELSEIIVDWEAIRTVNQLTKRFDVALGFAKPDSTTGLFSARDLGRRVLFTQAFRLGRPDLASQFSSDVLVPQLNESSWDKINGMYSSLFIAFHEFSHVDEFLNGYDLSDVRSGFLADFDFEATRFLPHLLAYCSLPIGADAIQPDSPFLGLLPWLDRRESLLEEAQTDFFSFLRLLELFKGAPNFRPIDLLLGSCLAVSAYVSLQAIARHLIEKSRRAEELMISSFEREVAFVNYALALLGVNCANGEVAIPEWILSMLRKRRIEFMSIVDAMILEYSRAAEHEPANLETFEGELLKMGFRLKSSSDLVAALDRNKLFNTEPVDLLRQ